jgi:3-phenylpropionate/trans-cinnamate dioxygenase ferredoxin reductase component
LAPPQSKIDTVEELYRLEWGVPNSPHYDVLIVGTGHGGANAAIALRQQKFTGSIGMIGDEVHFPYERPPLSKDYLSGKKAFERMLLRPQTFWAANAVDIHLAQRVVQVDPAGHRVFLSDGTPIGYGQLVWAAGGRPRHLICPGHELPGIHYIRTRQDVDRLALELIHANRIVVIGGGYIGLESAATLRKLGKQVTVVEALDRVLARVAGEALSRFYERSHVAQGVDLKLSSSVTRFEGTDGRLSAVRLSDGTVLNADLVIVGIGIIPQVDPLRDAGAAVSNGIHVDAQCRTTLPDIFAIGDCAAHPNAFAEPALIRLESIQNATDQAATVAKVIAGQPLSYDALPWFWSEQYDLRLQTVGLSHGHDDVVVRGSPEARSFSVIYLKQGRVIALDCVNMTRDFTQGRHLVLHRASPSSAQLADTAIELKSLHVKP